MFTRLLIKSIIIAGLMIHASSCQLVSKNAHTSPPVVKANQSGDLLTKIIQEELIPSLTTARTSLTILDSVRTQEKTNDSLADYVYELEKSLRSTALPKTEDNNLPANKEFLEIELPFVIGTHNQRLLAKLSRDRTEKDQIFDMFGIIPPPPSDKSQVTPLLSRMYDASNENSRLSFWFFDMPAFNNFLKILRNTNSNVIDPDLSMQFTTIDDSQELTVWSDAYQTGAMGVKWRRFHAEAKIGSSANIKIRIAILCNQKEANIEFTLEKSSLNGTIKDLIKNSINSKVDSSCIIN